MGDIKLIALDMDGTLFNNQGEISEKDKETLKRATEAGVAVAVATGRAYTELPVEMLYEVGIRYAITGNGSAVYRFPNKECVFSDCLEMDVLYDIIEELDKLDVYYDVYIEGLVYCPKSVCHNIRKMDMPEALHEHVERTRILLHFVDVSGIEGRNPLEDFDTINSELEKYSVKLSQKPQIVVANKCDIPSFEENFAEFKNALEEKGYKVQKYHRDLPKYIK